MGAETVHANELRRLEFVKSTSESVFSGTFKIAHSVYSTARTRIPVPGSVDAQIKNVESKVTEFTAPKFNQLQDYSGDWLTYADGKVAALPGVRSRIRAPRACASSSLKTADDDLALNRRPLRRWIKW